MSAETQVQTNHPLMKAWEAHKKTEAFANSARWAAHREHLDGSLWAVFLAGWTAHAQHCAATTLHSDAQGGGDE